MAHCADVPPAAIVNPIGDWHTAFRPLAIICFTVPMRALRGYRINVLTIRMNDCPGPF